MDLTSIQQHKVKMILQFSIPAIIAMVLTSFITITDGFFTGNYVGKEGLAAINLGVPVIYFYLGVGLMLAVGGSVIAVMALGAGNRDKCNAVFNQTIWATAIISFAVSIVMFFSFSPMMEFLRIEGLVKDYFESYYRIMLLELPIMVINNAFGMFIRGEGKPQFFMKISVLNVMGNLLLDYVFAKHLGFGIEGIAMASLISTTFCFACIIVYFLGKSSVYQFRVFRMDKEVFKNTVLNGSSEFIGEMSMCITMFAYNYVIMKHIGIEGMTAFTIVGYVSYVFGMILIGFGQGASSLISFAYGGGQKSLARAIRKVTNIFVLATGVFIMLVMSSSADAYSGVFIDNSAIEGMVISGIQIFTLSFLFSGINTITSFYFTSIGKAKESVVISLLRGLVVLLVSIFILPIFWGMNGVWMAAPVTELITIAVSIYLVSRNDRMEKAEEQ